MQRLILCLFALAALSVSPAAASAQETPQPGVVAVLYFKCQDTDTFDRVIETAWLPQIRRALEQGRLLGWGQLNHLWGDEWNRVLYHMAPDIQAFHAVFDEMFQATAEEHPDAFQEISRACSEHKDNIYSVARMLPMP